MKHYIKSALMLLGALAAIAFGLWAGHTSTHPGKPLQIIFLYAISAFILAATIIFATEEVKEGKNERKAKMKGGKRNELRQRKRACPRRNEDKLKSKYQQQ